jgi:hypothetical protein
VTTTVVVAVAEPPLFVAVSVYTVVWVGLTVNEVPVTAAPLTLYDVAPVADQVSVVDCPAMMLAEVDAKLVITGGGGVTATVAVAVVEPPLFVAVSV